MLVNPNTINLDIIKGKKLLLIGGSQMACNIVEKAHEMGVYVITTDQFDDSPAKLLSDESYMISTYDEDGLVRLCKEKQVDGIITGYIDSILPYYQKVCEKTGLPCYATEEQIEISINKDLFKKTCRRYNVPVIPEYTIDEDFKESDLQRIEYPVVVKPVDNSSSRGITVCYNHEQLIDSCKIALDFSEKKQFLVEKYFTTPSINVEYHLNDGEILLETIMDRCTSRTQDGYIDLPKAFFYPSCLLKRYLDEVNEKVIKMLKELGIKNGILFMSAFVSEEEFFFHEMGYRLGGAMAYKFVEKCCGYSPLELLINFSLTGKMSSHSIKTLVNPYYNGIPCVEIMPILKPGKIKTIYGIEALNDLASFLSIDRKHYPNETVKLIGTTDQMLARILFSGDINQLAIDLEKFKNTLKVTDENGNNQILDLFYGENLIRWYENMVKIGRLLQ